MKEILELLTNDRTAKIPIDSVDKFHAYVKTLPELYSFMYEYPDGESVIVTLMAIAVRHDPTA